MNGEKNVTIRYKANGREIETEIKVPAMLVEVLKDKKSKQSRKMFKMLNIQAYLMFGRKAKITDVRITSNKPLMESI